jgi:formyl-CoA transferase
MFDDPQVAAEGMITTYDHPVAGRYRAFQHPVKFSRTPGPDPITAPTLGQHTQALLAAQKGRA